MSPARTAYGIFPFTGLLFALALLSLAQTGAQRATPRAESHREFIDKLTGAAIEQTHHLVRYTSAYVRIPYPGGDVPQNTGVCTDVLIRGYRVAGIDLQKEGHEERERNLTR